MKLHGLKYIDVKCLSSFFLRDVCVLNILPRFSCWPSQRPLPPSVHGGLDQHCLQRTMNVEAIPGTVKWVVNRLKSVKRGVLGPCFVLFCFSFCQNWKGWNNKEKWGKNVCVYIYISTSFSLRLQKFLYDCSTPFHWQKSKRCCRISPKENTKDGTCQGPGLIIKWQSTALLFSTHSSLKVHLLF